MKEQLITELENLRKELLALSEELKTTGVERTSGLLEYMGNDCRFYSKSMDLFLSNDYERIRNRIFSLNALFQTLEGKKNG